MDRNKVWYKTSFANSKVTMYRPKPDGTCKAVVSFEPKNPTKLVYEKCEFKTPEGKSYD